jgi:cytochrome P450
LARSELKTVQIKVYMLTVSSLAYHEMRLVMAKVLYAFDFELAPESDNWKDQETFILWQKKPLMCKLKAVN